MAHLPYEYTEITVSEKAIFSKKSPFEAIVQYKDVRCLFYTIPSYGAFLIARYSLPRPGTLYIVTKTAKYWEDTIQIIASYEEVMKLPKRWLKEVIFSRGTGSSDVPLYYLKVKGIRYYLNRFREKLKRKK